MKRHLGFLLAVVLVCVSAREWGEEKPTRLEVGEQDIERLLRTDYYGVYMLGKKIGWARTSLVRMEGKGGGYVRSEEVSLKITAAGAKGEMHFIETGEYDAKPPYALRSAVSRDSDGKSVKETRLARRESGFDAVIQAGGETLKKSIAELDYTLGDLATVYVWIRQGRKKGDSITVRSLDFDELKTEREVYRLVGTKTAVADGVKVTYHEVEVTMVKEGLTGLARYDEKGEQELSMTLAGLFELRLEPEQVAKKTEFGGDLFELGKVKVDQKLGDASTISGLVLATVDKRELNLKSGPRQAVIRNDSGIYTLKLGKAYGVPAEATRADIEKHLAETAEYPISHPKVQALAKEAVGDARTTEDKVQRLARFVSGYLTPSYTAQPLTLMDVLKVRKGDCTEYAELFTTLARASGIAARDVAGLVYMGDEEKAFGLHAWNEAVVNGRWVPVDATFNETEINATHISFGSVAGDQAPNMAAAFGNLSLKVVEVERRK